MFEETAVRVVPNYADNEEAANAVTHGVGMLFSFVGVVAMAMFARLADNGQAYSCVIYTATLFLVYSLSTMLHAVRHPDWKYLLRRWDQGAVYLLISGTYTPFVWSYLAPPTSWIVMFAIWSFAVIGCYSKVVIHYRVLAFSPLSYILFGWLPALTMTGAVPGACVIWMVLGGMLYTTGTLFLRFDQRYRYFHAIWHVFVMLGSACHFYAVYAYACPAV